MRTNWPIALLFAACAHAGVVGGLAMVDHTPAASALARFESVEILINFENVTPDPVPSTPPEPSSFAAADPAMPPAESLPVAAAAARADFTPITNSLRSLKSGDTMPSTLTRLPAEVAKLQTQARLFFESLSASLDAIRQIVPAMPNRSRLPNAFSDNLAESDAVAGPCTLAAATASSASASTDAGTSLAPSRGPVPSGGNQHPIYPPEAARQRLEGIVTIRVRVGAMGEILDATVNRSAGSPLLDNAALTAVRAWRFDPAIDASGRGVACEANIPIAFRLHPERPPGK